jgi:hypothetical protein
MPFTVGAHPVRDKPHAAEIRLAAVAHWVRSYQWG